MLHAIAGVLGLIASAADNGGVPVSPPPQSVIDEHTADVAIQGHIFQPPELPPPPIDQLKVPAGFKIERYAEHLGNARVLAVSPAGNVYVTRRDSSDVLMIRDDGHGHAAAAPERVAGRSGLHGITFFGNKVYLVTVHEVFVGDVKDDGTFGPLTMLVHDLPDAGQHHTRMIEVGPDRALYVSVGSTCNYCNEPNPENATLLRISMDGTSRGIFAAGLRDTIGWGWHPQTGELWGMDQGMDWFGDDEQPEELNRIEKGKHYGWPYFYGSGMPNPHLFPPNGISREEMLSRVTPMTLGYTPHAASMQMSYYTGAQFPAEYQGDAFVSMRGSWNRKPASGYEVVRIHFDHGKPAWIRPFVTGFLTDKGESARPCGNAMARDGSLLFTDDRNGVIYRVSYTGSEKPGKAMSAAAPDHPAKEQALQDNPGKLAVQRPETQSNAALQVTSTSFADGQPMPAVYSAYEQDTNFPVAWSKGPANTQSYALIMEDPDSKSPPLPVIHWIAWNIPADVTSLHEAVAKQDQLDDIHGMRQGPNQSGAIGFHGMRPPQGDPPHHYHVQVFALDEKLDLPVRTTRDELVKAMQGHVLAKGELVGLFARPEHPAKP